MAENLMIGITTTLICLTIQCVVISAMLRVIFSLELRNFIRPTLPRTTLILLAALMVLFAGNLVQVSIWAVLFWWLGEFQTYGVAFYHSIVNFTSLGYGDIVMNEKFRLLGGIEAANGVLMFGLTTGFLYSIMTVFMRRAWQDALTGVETTNCTI